MYKKVWFTVTQRVNSVQLCTGNQSGLSKKYSLCTFLLKSSHVGIVYCCSRINIHLSKFSFWKAIMYECVSLQIKLFIPSVTAFSHEELGINTFWHLFVRHTQILAPALLQHKQFGSVLFIQSHAWSTATSSCLNIIFSTAQKQIIPKPCRGTDWCI